MANGVTQQETTTRPTRKTREQTAAEQAAELLVFADGIADAGHPELARRSRVVARETIWLVQSLEAERSARQATQQARDNCLQILANHAAEAAEDDGT